VAKSLTGGDSSVQRWHCNPRQFLELVAGNVSTVGPGLYFLSDRLMLNFQSAYC